MDDRAEKRGRERQKHANRGPPLPAPVTEWDATDLVRDAGETLPAFENGECRCGCAHGVNCEAARCIGACPRILNIAQSRIRIAELGEIRRTRSRAKLRQ